MKSLDCSICGKFIGGESWTGTKSLTIPTKIIQPYMDLGYCLCFDCMEKLYKIYKRKNDEEIVANINDIDLPNTRDEGGTNA